jgi:cation diffusion facilitator family transporter
MLQIRESTSPDREPLKSPLCRIRNPVKTNAARLSIISNASLVLLKLVVGGLTGSVSVLSEAIHSAVDLLASFIAFWAVRASEAPADQEHPFGHGKYENVSGAIEGFLIVAAGFVIAYEAIRKLIHNESPEKLGLALGVMLLSAVVNFFVSRWLIGVAEQTQSEALYADAFHLRTDVYTSVGVLVGLALVALTGRPAFDPITALLVTTVVFLIGGKTTLGSLKQLTDVALPHHEIERIEQLARDHPSILGFHQVRTRRVGGQRQVDLHIQVPGDLSVREGHSIAHQLQDQLKDEMKDIYVVIHVEPWEENPDFGF